MGVYEVKDRQSIAPLFAGWEETFIWSYLQGCMGRAYASGDSPVESALILTGDFCCLAGRACRELLEDQQIWEGKGFIILVPQSEAWSELIEKCLGSCAVRRERYALKKEGDLFDREKLFNIVNGIREPYEIRMIDEEIFHEALASGWAQDLCSQFEDYDDYKRRGLGAAVLKHGELVSGASSYIVYREGIEIEIDTREDERRKGLALACGAKLILECLERGLYPSWDAHNLGSLRLAEKLGYHFDKAYPAYEVSFLLSEG